MPRDTEEEGNVFGMEEGCVEHGGDHMVECLRCGTEFCTRCFPRSAVCADCAEDDGLEGEASGEDFADVDKLDKVLQDETAAERAKNDDDDSP